MIKYALACVHGHEFEGWFSTSADYDDQHAKGLVECPLCASSDVTKQIMAPAVAGAKARGGPPQATPQARQQMMMQAMSEVRRHVEATFDNVGDGFAKEARAIHEGKAEERGIYGEATPKEVRELIDDGVKIAPLPPKPPEKGELN